MKKVNKGAKRRLFVWFFAFIIIVSYMSYTTFLNWQKILKNKNETLSLKKRYNKLVSDKKVLESDVVKLQDPEYVAKYARERYLYSKDGELIIKIIDDNK